MGQPVSTDGRPEARLQSVAELVSQLTYFDESEYNWEAFNKVWVKRPWEEELAQLIKLFNGYRNSVDAIDRQQSVLTSVLKAWCANVRELTCGKDNELACLCIGNMTAVILAASLQCGMKEDEIVVLFSASDGARDAEGGPSAYEMRSRGLAVLEDVTSAAVDVIVSGADPANTSVGLDVLLILCSAELFGVLLFRTFIDQHLRREHLVAKLIHIASATSREKAKKQNMIEFEESHSQAYLGTSMGRSALELISMVSPGAGHDGEKTAARNALAELALSLLTVLCGARRQGQYRLILNALHNSGRGEPANGEGVAVSFRALFDALGSWMQDERGVVLCYTLVTGNKRFCSFAMARTDPETIVLPLLRMLFRVSKEGNARTAGLIAGTFLYMTELSTFRDAIGIVTTDGLEPVLPPPKDGKPASAGTLAEVLLSTVLVSLRQIVGRTQNTQLCRLHLAVAANVCDQLRALDATLAERMVRCLESMIRKVVRLKNQEDDADTVDQYVEVVALMLELYVRVIRATWSTTLFYSMLHQEHVFRSLRPEVLPASPATSAHCFAVAARLNGTLENLKGLILAKDARGHDPILQLVDQHAKEIADHYLSELPDLTFRFREVHEPDFFQTYAWEAGLRQLVKKWDLRHCRIKPK